MTFLSRNFTEEWLDILEEIEDFKAIKQKNIIPIKEKATVAAAANPENNIILFPISSNSIA